MHAQDGKGAPGGGAPEAPLWTHMRSGDGPPDATGERRQAAPATRVASYLGAVYMVVEFVPVSGWVVE